ncbi:unnamed protein product [Caenorhabditis auriculariae]|uniref:ShKT domain-containing protein n=1 Tax=Caenorhabditis auriculariae TaxID=2777116 RepID=A0A8S1GY95_9PELO|nr:unnamed protein product [Caenorhabditis auriculariae]
MSVRSASYFVLICSSALASMDLQPTAWKATRTPCCMDTLMPSVCKSLYNRDHERFTRSCRTNADFSFIQCCHSCHFNIDLFTGSTVPVPNDIYMKDVEELLLRTNANTCFDRHGSNFCEAFVTRAGPWGRRALTCQQSAFAFRVCRKTCGYCNSSKPATVRYDSTVAKDPKTCERLF